MCKMNVVMTLKTGVSYILDCDLATFERDTSNRVLVPYKASMLINSKLRIHMIDWIFTCTGCKLNRNTYPHKYPFAVSLVESIPQFADKNSKEFYLTVKGQRAAVLQKFKPNNSLAKRGNESGDSHMQIPF